VQYTNRTFHTPSGELINKSMELQTELLALPQAAEQKGVQIIYLT